MKFIWLLLQLNKVQIFGMW